jgi:hypothetical protein
MGERRSAYRNLVAKLAGKILLEYQGLHGRIILRWIIRKWDGRQD